MSQGKPQCCCLPMHSVKGFVFGKAFTHDVGAHCHPATGFQVFPSGALGNLYQLGMDPPTGVAYRIWFLWPWLGSDSRWLGWNFMPGSSGGVEPHWGPSLRVGHCEYIGPVVVEMGASNYSTVSLLTRKRVIPWGNVGSLPSSSSMLNLTSFCGFSSTWMEALHHHALLLDSQVLD